MGEDVGRTCEAPVTVRYGNGDNERGTTRQVPNDQMLEDLRKVLNREPLIRRLGKLIRGQHR